MKRKKFSARILSSILIAAITAGSITVMPPVSKVSAASSDETLVYGNEKNAVTNEVYQGMGIVNSSPDEFNPEDTSNPLEDYEPIILSELYVGYMNRFDNWEGDFMVMDNVSDLSESSLNLDNMDNKLVGNKVSFSKYYEEDKDPIEVQTHNSCAIDMDGDGTDEILDVMFYVNRDEDKTSWMDIRVHDLTPNTSDVLQWNATDKVTIRLTDKNSDTKDFVWDIEANTSKAFTALAAGDYDHDGKDEAAVYVPSKIGNNSCVIIYDITDDKKFSEKNRIYVSELNDGDSNKFNYEYESDCLPIVSLSTTSIAGYDDLVVNVSHPMDDDGDTNKYGHSSAMGIYHYDNGSLKRAYANLTMRYGNYRMRFSSAVDTDLNGNGINELLIGGYKNTDWSSNTDVGELSDKNNLIQVICWDTQKKEYVTVWNEPKSVAAMTELDVDKMIMEPAALTAGKMRNGTNGEQVFLEGILFEFTPGTPSSTKTEAELLKSGSFINVHEMNLGGHNSPFISTACAAVYSSEAGNTEQIVVLSGDFVKTDNDKIYYDIVWLWEENNTSYKSRVTNNDYIDRSDEDDNGTFISICPMNVDEDTMYLKYDSKQCGWSQPELYCVIQSIPYWKEITYSLDYAGSTSYTVSYATGTGMDANYGIGGGITLGASALFGGGLAGNNVLMGAGVDLTLMAQYIGSYAKEHTETDEYETIVYPGKDYAVVYAVPLVSYKYKVWVPTFTVDQAYIDSYKSANGGSCPYKVGQVIEAHEEDYFVQKTCAPSMNCLELDKYNELVDKYKDQLNLTQITPEMFADKVIGDPSTYPSDIIELQSPGNVVEGSVHVSPTANVASGDIESHITYSVSDSKSESQGISLSFDGQVCSKASVEVSLGIGADIDGYYGYKFVGQGSHVQVTSSEKGMSFSTLFKNTPSGTSEKYNYNAQMAVYKINNASAGNGNNPYVVGYIVTGADEKNVPPSLPKDFRVFATTENSIVLKWEDNDRRKAESYEIFVKDNLGAAVSLKKVSDLYYVATGLDANKKYEFAIRAYSEDDGQGTVSVLSNWISGVTKSNDSGTPQFIKTPKNVIITNSEELPLLEAEAEAGLSGAEITYKWQKLGDESEWVYIEGATQSTYQLESLPDTDPTYYRVIATQKKGSNVQSIISRTAAVFLSEENANIVYNLDTKVTVATESGEFLYEEDGTYFVSGETKKIICNVELINKENAEAIPNGDNVEVICIDENNNKIVKSGTITDGKITVEFDTAEIQGNYKIYIEYRGRRDGGVVYMPICSEDVSLRSVIMYRLNYHVNGRTVTSQNPTVLTSESGEVSLESATMNGYRTTGWYWDEELQNEVDEQTVTVQLMSEMSSETKEINLYSSWEPISEDEEENNNENETTDNDGTDEAETDETKADDSDKDKIPTRTVVIIVVIVCVIIAGAVAAILLIRDKKNTNK